MTKIYKILATFGPVGYLPIPGTMGTLASLPLVMLIKLLGVSCMQEVAIVALCILLALVSIQKGLQWWQEPDPKQIVLDEVVGFMCALVCVPLNIKTTISAFLLFRLFDIYKPWPICLTERLSGAWGIVFDDVAAGIFTLVLIRMIISL